MAVSNSTFKGAIVPICLIVIVLIFWVISENLKPHFKNPHLRAPVYERPIGCTVSIPVDDLATGMPCYCADAQYKFVDADKYGFIYLGRRNNYFFRVGNDAVEIAFDEINFNPKGICWKKSIVRNVFHQ